MNQMINSLFNSKVTWGGNLEDMTCNNVINQSRHGCKVIKHYEKKIV